MSNTGFKAYTDLEQYYINSGIATGTTKINSISDPDYVAPVYDTTYCPLPSASPSATPSVTPTVTPTITPTITVTPTISVTPSITPTISATPSLTPTISVTPTITVTPSITPSISTSALVYNYYEADIYECISGYCSYSGQTINIANATPLTVDPGKYYYDYNNNYILTIIGIATTGPYQITNITDPSVKNCELLCFIIP
jgi:hypothetical protein